MIESYDSQLELFPNHSEREGTGLDAGWHRIIRTRPREGRSRLYKKAMNYSQEDDELIRTRYQELGRARIAKMLDRTQGSVSARRRYLKTKDKRCG